jgi:hypothetical protein
MTPENGPFLEGRGALQQVVVQQNERPRNLSRAVPLLCRFCITSHSALWLEKTNQPVEE